MLDRDVLLYLMLLGMTVPQKATQYLPGSRDYLTLGDSLDSPNR